MTGAKSVLKVKKEETFLDLTVRQIEHLNVTNHADVPLILMTSFNTNEDTNRLIKKYANRPPRITTFNQSRYPRICADTKLPCPKHVEDEKKAWYPPGHGDLYDSLLHSGVLNQLLNDGKEYLFVSNSDNLGAVWVPYPKRTCLCWLLPCIIVLTKRSYSIWLIASLNSWWRSQTRPKLMSRYVRFSIYLMILRFPSTAGRNARRLWRIRPAPRHCSSFQWPRRRLQVRSVFLPSLGFILKDRTSFKCEHSRFSIRTTFGLTSKVVF